MVHRLAAVVLALSAVPALPAQFKSEVDGLVRFFRQTARESGALGDGTCRHTAMVLTAMGHSHRFYALQDGPVIRKPVNFLFSCRKADGSFADAAGDAVETTRWVIDALAVLEPEAFATEIASGRRWLKGRTRQPSAFAARRISKDDAKARAEAVARGPIQGGDGKVDVEASVQALLDLVRHQADMRPKNPITGAPTWTKTQQKGFDSLLKHQEDGRFFVMQPVSGNKFVKVPHLGMTGMGLAALSTKPAEQRSDAEQALIDKGLKWLLESQNENGSFGDHTVNYTTCAAIFALSKAGDPDHKDALQRAQRYILGIQNAEAQGYKPADKDYGSIGYGGDERGDLSNLQFGVEALRKTGIDKQHEALAKAIVFLQRTQNLRKVNDYSGKMRNDKGEWEHFTSGNDGGSAYYPGNSPAGYLSLPDGTKIPRSYGSMTYALLKTYTLCGVERNDPRIQAAVDWIRKNWSLDINPGSDPQMGEKAKYQGLFYYYMVMAQALSAAGIDSLKVGEGEGAKEVLWRGELRAKLAALQSDSGGWLNEKNGRWWEESDLVCTTYAMLALELCR